MRVLVCGSRHWKPVGPISAVLRGLLPVDVVVTGGAPGADTAALAAAHSLGIPTEVYPADWKEHGKAAGPIRNRQMLDTGPDLVLAFWDGTSRGTKDTVTEARKRGIPVRVYMGDTDTTRGTS